MSACEKACTGCGVVKSLDDFHRNKRSKDGRVSACRGCVSEERRRYYEENREKIVEKVSRYGEENREKIAGRKRRYYEESRDYLNAKSLDLKMNCQRTSELFLSKPKWAPWTPEEDALLLVNDGRTCYQKAIELGRTYASVSSRLRRLRKSQAQ